MACCILNWLRRLFSVQGDRLIPAGPGRVFARRRHGAWLWSPGERQGSRGETQAMVPTERRREKNARMDAGRLVVQTAREPSRSRFVEHPPRPVEAGHRFADWHVPLRDINAPWKHPGLESLRPSRSRASRPGRDTPFLTQRVFLVSPRNRPDAGRQHIRTMWEVA